LLGGNTATLWEGRITQFNSTTEVYRKPTDMTTARVFSNPPMNFLDVEKNGDEILFGEGQNLKAGAGLANLEDGHYIAGFRPNHLEIDEHCEGAMEFSAMLEVTEITGSETFLHLQHGPEKWIGHVHGVQELPLGADIPVYLDPSHIYIFGKDGGLIEAASYALSNPSLHAQQA